MIKLLSTQQEATSVGGISTCFALRVGNTIVALTARSKSRIQILRAIPTLTPLISAHKLTPAKK